jgi:hypothetical protein
MKALMQHCMKSSEQADDEVKSDKLGLRALFSAAFPGEDYDAHNALGDARAHARLFFSGGRTDMKSLIRCVPGHFTFADVNGRIQEQAEQFLQKIHHPLPSGWKDEADLNVEADHPEYSGSAIGPLTGIRKDIPMLELWMKYIPLKWLEQAAQQSNLYARQLVKFNSQHHWVLAEAADPAAVPRSGDPLYDKITPVSILNFIGILYRIGARQFRSMYAPWSDDEYDEKIANTMSRRHFSEHVRFLKIPEMPSAGRHLSKVQSLLDAIRNGIRHTWTSGQMLTLDESMIPFLGRVPFRVTIPGKPNPTGLKVYMICDSEGMPVAFELYLGSTDDNCGQKIIALVDRLLNSVFLDIDRKGHVLFTDNYYTTIKLALHLMKNYGIHLVGVIRNRVNSVKATDDLSYPFLNLPDNIVKKIQPGWKKLAYYDLGDGDRLAAYQFRDMKKAVSLLSTAYVGKSATSTVHRKSKTDHVGKDFATARLHKEYVDNYQSVDRLDRSVADYTTDFKTSRWHMKVFCWALDLAAHCTWRVYKGLHGTQENFDAAMKEQNVGKSKGVSQHTSYQFALADTLMQFTVTDLHQLEGSCKHDSFRKGGQRSCFGCRQHFTRDHCRKCDFVLCSACQEKLAKHEPIARHPIGRAQDDDQDDSHTLGYDGSLRALQATQSALENLRATHENVQRQFQELLAERDELKSKNNELEEHLRQQRDLVKRLEAREAHSSAAFARQQRLQELARAQTSEDRHLHVMVSTRLQEGCDICRRVAQEAAHHGLRDLVRHPTRTTRMCSTCNISICDACSDSGAAWHREGLPPPPPPFTCWAAVIAQHAADRRAK